MKVPSFLASLRTVFRFLNAEERRIFLSVAAFAVVIASFEIIASLAVVFLAQALNTGDAVLNFINSRDYLAFLHGIDASGLLLFAAGTAAVVFVVKNALAAFDAFYQFRSFQKINIALKHRMMKKYARLDYAESMRMNSSYGSTVIDTDIEQLGSIGFVALAGIFSEAIVFIVLTGFIIAIKPSLAAVIILLGGVLAFVTIKYVFPQFYLWGNAMQQATMRARKALFQFFQGYKDVILSGRRDAFIEMHQVAAIEKGRAEAIKSAASQMPRLVLESVFILIFVAAIAVMVMQGAGPQQIVIILGAYLYAGYRLMPGLNRIVNHLSNFKSVMAGIERINQNLQADFAADHFADVPGFTFDRDLTMTGVSYAYPGTDRVILKPFDLVIRRGEWIGIVGETGSGKSTLVDLLLGLLHPVTGRIVVDGHYPVESLQWHRHIGYVPQSLYLVDDTIRANIAFGIADDDIDDDKIMRAMRHARLDDFIARLPDGIQTVVGERGVRLSGGERQRISIARALYHDPDVLVFDEATSALDHETERAIISTITDISADKTMIMIAHRTDTLRSCHRIIRVQDGRVFEEMRTAA